MATPQTARQPDRVRPWAAFNVIEFRYLWANSFTFALVQSTERFAFVWLMLELYGSADEAGRITFVLGIPVLLFSLQAGALADRLDRRLLMIATQSAAALVSLALTLLLFANKLSYPLTIALALLLGTSLAFGAPVRTSTIPIVVPTRLLLNAIVVNGFATNVSMIIGPAIGGFVIQTWDVEGVFAMSTLLYVAGIVALLPLRLPRNPGSEQHRRSGRERGAIKAGLRFMVGHAGIRSLFLCLTIFGVLLIGPFAVLVPHVARVRLHRDVVEASLMFTALGAGTIMATLVLASVGDIHRKGRTFLTVCASCGAVLAAVGISTSYLITICLMFAWGLLGGILVNMIHALVQSNTPHEYLGRVASLQSLAMQGVMPIGALLAGWGADTFDVMPWLVVSGACLAIATVVVAVTQPALRRM